MSDSTTEEFVYETRAPGVLSDQQRPVIEELGLEKNCRELTETGWTVIEDVADPELNDRLHKAIVDTAVEFVTGPTGPYPAGANMVLTKDPAFAEAVLNPKILAMCDFSIGRGSLITQLSTSVFPQGVEGGVLHSDQSWLPAPHPEHNQILTACWSTNGYSKEGGSTMLVPGSHKLRRNPYPDEIEAMEGAIGVDCPPNSAVVWDGSIWHTNWPRTIPGQRVVFHISYNRLSLRPVEDYSPWADELVGKYGPVMSQLLGREDFLSSTTGFDSTKIYATINNARS